MQCTITAGELATKALNDTTNYNCLELGHALVDDVGVQLRKCIDTYKSMIGESEFCIVRVMGTDPLIKNAFRWKYYAWPFLPKPRPSQSVFLYNKAKDDITMRLWTLPNALLMAKLASDKNAVPDSHKEMQAWSIAFFEGKFWDYIRYDKKINLLSETEYKSQHRQEFIDGLFDSSDTAFTDTYDFSKVQINKVVDPANALIL